LDFNKFVELEPPTIVVGNLAHFLTNGEHRKGQRHYKRHGKNDRVHLGIISHFRHLQQFCYNLVTLLWLSLAGSVPVIASKLAAD
jgi:hypothetical protein